MTSKKQFAFLFFRDGAVSSARFLLALKLLQQIVYESTLFYHRGWQDERVQVRMAHAAVEAVDRYCQRNI